MAIAWVVVHENVQIEDCWLGAASILAGAALLSWQGDRLSIDHGALFIAGACPAWGIDNNLTRKVSNADPVTIAMLKGVIAGIVNVGLAFISGASFPEPIIALAAGIVGFIGVGVSLVMFVLALRYLGTARTGAYYSLAPFIGALLAIFVLSEPVTISLVAAALLMGFGLYLHLAERHSHEHQHEAFEHTNTATYTMSTISIIITGLSQSRTSHCHRHEPMLHSHIHYPDLHHQHRH